MITFVTSHFALCVAGVCFLIFLALAVGYIVGNNVYNHNADEQVKEVIDKLEYQGAVRSSIIDNVNLGVITYDSNSIVYNNKTIQTMEGFLNGDPVPSTMEAFLDRFEQGNHLKSDYLLNVDNTDTAIRVNYTNGKNIFEIKILHRMYEDTRLDIVIVDDITQIEDDERRQKDLAANVSHELKTPLTVIRASELFINNITLDNMPSYDEIKKWGTRVVTNAVRMQDIVQDFLTLSMCQDAVPMTIVDIGEVINRAVGSVAEYPGRDKVNIKIPENMYYPLVFGSENLIMRVVINLLTNAIKYMQYDGKTEPNTVDVSVSAIGDRIGIEVSDNGMGVPQKDVEYLFDRFFRVDNSGSRETGGSGIGLSIVKDIVDMHEGTINVSTELHQGSSFTVILPVAGAVFSSVFEDAVDGIVSEKTYYRTAADFIALQAVEAARSMGYDDVEGLADEFEAIPAGEKTLREKKLVELLKAFGEERYTDLVDELTFIDPDMFDDVEEDEADEPVSEPVVEEAETIEVSDEEPETDNESMENEPAAAVVEKAESEEERAAREERERREEAKAILTQQILPRAVPSKPLSEEEKKQAVTVHPNEINPERTTPRKKRKGSLFLDLTSHTEDNNETEIKSAVRQVLDETEGK
ncbi:MAG: HAMP domain-containing histidine kinase [Saccharofermentans sp.]|nr:HAMP domain-containing histidine kinase [Saccharofermentans sp.]